MIHNILIIVQARIGGTRLPGKIMQPILDQPMLLWQLDRLTGLKKACFPCNIITAIPNTKENESLSDMLMKHGYTVCTPCVPENDVLARYASVIEDQCKIRQYAWIVRITGDCPLIDVDVIEAVIRHANSTMATYVALAKTWPDGLDVEVMAPSVLLTAHAEATEASDREHCTPWIWRHPERFHQELLPCLFDLSRYKWSVDTKVDLELARHIYANLLPRFSGGRFGWRDIHAFVQLDRHAQRLMQQQQLRNQGYLEQIGAESGWDAVRYGEIEEKQDASI